MRYCGLCQKTFNTRLGYWLHFLWLGPVTMT